MESKDQELKLNKLESNFELSKTWRQALQNLATLSWVVPNETPAGEQLIRSSRW